MLSEQPARTAKAAPDEPSSQMESVSRRTFLQASAAAGGGLLLSLALPMRHAAGTQPVEEFAPNAFIRIGSDGRVTLIMTQVEMGQGTYTSMPMLIAEELEVDLDQVHLEHAPPDDRLYANPLVGFQVTGGSTSVRAFWKPLREAGAAARMLLSKRRRKPGAWTPRPAARKPLLSTTQPAAGSTTARSRKGRQRCLCPRLTKSCSRTPRTSS